MKEQKCSNYSELNNNSQSSHVVGQVDVDPSRGTKSQFSRTNFVKWRKTSTKLGIPDWARKEVEFLYILDIVSKVKKYEIPSVFIVNIDQASLKYVLVSNETVAAKGEHSLTISVQ